MKKLFLFAVMAMISVTSFAQGAKGSIRLTPYVGMTLANCTNSDGETDIKPGLIAGGEAMYQVTDVIAVSGGLFFAQEGCQGKEDGAKMKLNNNYLNIPILVNAYVAPGLAVKLGVQPAILLSAKISASARGNSASIDVKDSYNTFDFALPIGLSYEFKKFVVDARYNFGLTKLLKDVDSSENTKNSVFQIMVGYRF